MKRIVSSILVLMYLTVWPAVAWANPYFFVSGDPRLIHGYSYHYSVYLYTDGQTVTAAQTVLNFDSSQIEVLSLGILDSRCSFWAPPDPSLGYGNTAAPYIHQTNKVVISCGFSNPGYMSTSQQGDMLVKLHLTATETATGLSTMTFSDTLYRYIGNTITPGNSQDFDVSVYDSTESANPSPTSWPTPTPPNPDTIDESVLNFVEIGTGSGANSTQSIDLQTQQLNLLESQNQITTISDQDNSIPPPPNMTPRPTEEPYLIAEADTEDEGELNIGEVLSITSLRELLFPGKSEADQRVVLVNLISTLAFLVILAVLVWRLITNSRMNKLKYRHMRDMMTGELSAIEGKLGSESTEENNEVIIDQLEDLKKNLEDSK